MAKRVTQVAISSQLANTCLDSSSKAQEIVVQVLDLKPTGSKYMFTASDGKMKLKSLLQSSLSLEVMAGNIQNLGLISILDYAVNVIPTKNEKFLIAIKCEAVSPALESEIKTEEKSEEFDIILKPKQEMGIKSEAKSAGTGIILKPKQELFAKSAAQIVHEENGKKRKRTRGRVIDTNAISIKLKR